MKFLLAIVIYIVLAAAHVALLYIAATKYANGRYDTWPIVCGIFWPVAGPIAAAYIAAKWFIDAHK